MTLGDDADRAQPRGDSWGPTSVSGHPVDAEPWAVPENTQEQTSCWKPQLWLSHRNQQTDIWAVNNSQRDGNDVWRLIRFRTIVACLDCYHIEGAEVYMVWDAGIQWYISNQVQVRVYFKRQLCLPPDTYSGYSAEEKREGDASLKMVHSQKSVMFYAEFHRLAVFSSFKTS